MTSVNVNEARSDGRNFLAQTLASTFIYGRIAVSSTIVDVFATADQENTMPRPRQSHPHAADHLPDTLAGYLALQREADLARAAARSTTTPVTHSPRSAVSRSHARDVTRRYRRLLSGATITRRRARPSPVACGVPRLVPAPPGAGRAELACCP